MVRRESVRLQHHEVIDRREIERRVAVDGVVQGDFARERRLEAHDAAPHFRLRLAARLCLSLRLAAAPIVLRWLLQPRLLRAHRIEPLGRAPTLVRVALRQHAVGSRAIVLDALRLHVRPVRPTDVRPFVVVEPEPAQALGDLRDGIRYKPRAVGVFEPEDELASEVPGQ